MYLTRMEESYLHFDKAAEVFVHESPTLLLEERESSSANAFSVQLDNQVSSSCSSQMASACMAQKGVAASSMRDGHASSVSFHTSLPTSQNGIAPSSQIGATAPPPLPTVSTGPTRARSRSYSVDLVTRPSSSLNPDRSDQITVSLRSRCDIGRSHRTRTQFHPAPTPRSVGGSASSAPLPRPGATPQRAAPPRTLRSDAVSSAAADRDHPAAIRTVSARADTHRRLRCHAATASRPPQPLFRRVAGRLSPPAPPPPPQANRGIPHPSSTRRNSTPRSFAPSPRSSTERAFPRDSCSRCRCC